MKNKNLSYFYNLAKYQLYKLNRSITGKDTLKTLQLIKNEFNDLKIKKIKSGKKIFDWNIPPEWNVKKAFILDKNKKKVINFKDNNLHLLNYSIPINKKIKKKELFKHLHYLKSQPNAIPYATSYYKKNWGFCLSYNQFKKINKEYKDNDFFEIIIDSTLNKKGNLNYGEYLLKGESKKEILISTYICHPSMANNELSGPIVSMLLMNYFKKKKLSKSLRFIFIPETIGSIAYISKNIKKLKKYVIGGFNLTCIGDEREHSCMLSKFKNSTSDFAILEAYKKLKIKRYKIYSFLERGSDERQYNSPGIDLGITSIFRSKYGTFPEYHTSLDNFNLVTTKGINGGFNVAKKSIEVILNNHYPKYSQLCEPKLSKKNLYPTLSVKKNRSAQFYLDFLQYADGKTSLETISKYINKNIKFVRFIFKKLKKNKLIY